MRGDGAEAGETELGEDPVRLLGNAELRVVCVANLVVAELEPHRAPGLAEVLELDVERPHRVGRGNVARSRGALGDHTTREPVPAARERIRHVGDERVEARRPRGIQIDGRAGDRVPEPYLQRGAALHRAVRQHLPDEAVGDGGPRANEAVLGAGQTDYRPVEVPPAVRGLHFMPPSAFAIPPYSRGVTYPCSRAAFAACASRSGIIFPLHASIASRAFWLLTPLYVVGA